jgi:hypothetical protein
MRELKIGDHGEDVRRLKVATNRRLDARGLSSYKVDAKDERLRTKDIDSIAKATWALGAHPSTYKQMEKEGTVTVGAQRMIRNPGKRNERQQKTGQIRMANMRKQRKKRAAAKAKGGARARTIHAALARVGTVEHPSGSNGGGQIDVWQHYWGFGHVAWCGIFAGYHAEKFGKLTALQSDVASVAAIEGHARNHNGGYGSWHSSVDGALPGSFVVIGGHGIHVGLLVEAIGGGRAKTVEGNTSFGPGGSQSNGGCVAARVRSDGEIFGVASMNYPG